MKIKTGRKERGDALYDVLPVIYIPSVDSVFSDCIKHKAVCQEYIAKTAYFVYY